MKRKYVSLVLLLTAWLICANAFCQSVDKKKAKLASQELVPCDWLLNIMVKVNGYEMPFIMDTGATTVGIPEDIGRKLLADGAILPEDSIGTIQTSYADGSRRSTPIYKIRDLEIGGVHIKNVEATFNQGDPLLGMLAIASLGPVEITSDRLYILKHKIGDEVECIDRQAFASLKGAKKKKNTVCFPLKAYKNVHSMNASLNTSKIDFIFDTGASRINVSGKVGQFMLNYGYIKETDCIGRFSSTTASGNSAAGKRYNIKEVNIGDIKIKNVEMNVSPNPNSENVLGMSAISALMPFIIDGSSLIIENHKEGDVIEASNYETFDRYVPLFNAGKYKEAEAEADQKIKYSYNKQMRQYWEEQKALCRQKQEEK